MFNMYTKVATALGFALLFSTGAWGQCADGSRDRLLDRYWTVPSEISWQLNDAAGNNVFTAVR